MNINDLKKNFNKKVLPLALAASIFVSTPMGEIKAKAYNLEEPTVTYDEFKELDYTIIFLGGRMMEFSKETGYPYKKSKKLMVPTESICKGIYGVYDYDSKTNTAKIMRHGVTITVKKGSKKITVNDHGTKKTVKSKVAATLKNGKLFVQLSSISEALGLTLKSNKTTGVINLNYTHDYENIDLKNNENNLVNLSKVKESKYSKVMLDMIEVDKDYVNVLKNTNQYKAFIENDTLFIFTNQLFENIDYLYGKKKELDSQWYQEEKDVALEDVKVELENIYNSDILEQDEDYFLNQLTDLISGEMNLTFLPENAKNNSGIIHLQKMSRLTVTHEQYLESVKRAREIIEEEKNILEELDNYISLFQDLPINYGYWYTKYQIGGKNYYDSLIKKAADCVGFQNALELMFRECKYPIVNVDGDLAGGPHLYGYAYNEEEGKWYVVDATNGIYDTIEKEKEHKLTKREPDTGRDTSRELVMKTYKFYDKEK